ncbi:hypothetical protein FBQ97_03390 [Acidobacteria bacterium ACD]|nr:MAG: hypothetical protein EDX89_16915 [Acidobacteriota bacterium]MDL1948840.1 hypothetical protein [Acidobacteria bacterium ACD]
MPRLFLLLGVLTPLVVYAVFRSHRFQEVLRRSAERRLTQAAGRPVTIGGFDLALLPPRFVVRQVELANDPRGLPGPAFSASEIELRGFPRVAERSVDLKKVRVLSPRVLLEVYEDGSTNFSNLFRGRDDSSGGGTDVRLGEAVLQRGELRFREWKAPLDVTVAGAALTARSGRHSKVTGVTLLCRSARLVLGGREPFDFRLSAEAVLSPRRVHVSRVVVEHPEISLVASGGVDDLDAPEVAFAGRASFEADALDRYFGAGVALSGRVEAEALLRVPKGEGFRVRGRFEVPAGRLGPFEVSGTGRLRIDPEGVLVEAGPLALLGGTAEAVVRVARLKGPPLPVRIAARGTGLDFERFFSDIGLPGTGLTSRADLDAELTFAEGGLERADGSAQLRLRAERDRPSAVAGRHALPVSGGGTLLLKKGKILFGGTPLTTEARTRVELFGSIAIGSWEPDLGFEVEAADLSDVERLAANFYPAITGEPLEPALELGGQGRFSGRLTRAFGDPRVEGRLTARGFRMRGARFGEVTAGALVDRDVLTLSPFSALDGGARLVATGSYGWGASLGGHYELSGFELDVEAWPLQRILDFLDFDLPLSGPVTGRIPLRGLTPEVHGSGRLEWSDGSAWGQPVDSMVATLAFEGDRMRLLDATALRGGGCLKGDAEYAWDESFRFGVDLEDLPLDGLSAAADLVPGLAAGLSGRFEGEGTLDHPRLVARLSARRPAYEGRAVGAEAAVSRLELDVDGRDVDGSLVVPGVARLLVDSRPVGDAVETRLDLRVESLGAVGAAVGVPSDVALAGSLSASGRVEVDPATGELTALDVELGEGQIGLAGRLLETAGGRIRVRGDEVRIQPVTLRSEGDAGSGLRPETSLTLSGRIGLEGERPLALGVEGVVDAAELTSLVGAEAATGPIAVGLEVGGTLDAPVLTGRLALEGVDFLPRDSNDPVEGISGTLRLTPGRVEVSGLTFRYDGLVSLAGVLALEGLSVKSLRLNAHLEDVRSRPFPGFRCTVSGDLVLLGDSWPRTARGDLTMTSGLYTEDLNFDLGSLLGRLGPAALGGAPAASAFDALALDVRIVAPPASIEARNNVARLRARAELFARGTWGRPLLFGQVEAEDGGRMTLRGQRYEVLSGKILFSNPERIEPFFDFSTRTTIRDYQVSFGLTGTPSRLAPRFSADPPLSEAQIVSLLLTGELPESTVAGAPPGQGVVSSDESISVAAKQLLASLATDAAAERTRELFGLDRLQIDPVFSGASFQAARLTIGKSISRDLTVTYSYTASSNQEQILEVDYQISPNVFLQFRRDENGVYSADLKVRHRLR